MIGMTEFQEDKHTRPHATLDAVHEALGLGPDDGAAKMVSKINQLKMEGSEGGNAIFKVMEELGLKYATASKVIGEIRRLKNNADQCERDTLTAKGDIPGQAEAWRQVSNLCRDLGAGDGMRCRREEVLDFIRDLHEKANRFNRSSFFMKVRDALGMGLGSDPADILDEIRRLQEQLYINQKPARDNIKTDPGLDVLCGQRIQYYMADSGKCTIEIGVKK